jgi:toxin secretion/phage lysis holin
MNETKIMICTVLGGIGANLSLIFGEWTESMTTLAIMMGIDYIMGIMIASVFKKSEKSKNGGINSRSAWMGICKKVGTLLLVAVAYRIDVSMKTNFLKDGVCVAFITSEGISIIENARVMGLPIPEILVNALDGLKGGKDGKDNK